MATEESHVIRLPILERPLWDSDRLSLQLRRFKHRYRLLKKWWLRPHVPYQPLFVIATCRSGSNLLLSYLGQQPGVAMLGEVLCHLVPIGPSRERISATSAIRHIRRCLQAEKMPVRGCKLMLYQLSNCQLSLDHLNEAFPSARYIILYRQSLAEQFFSQRLAWVTNQYALRDGEQPRRAKITIDRNELRAFCDEMRSGYREVLAHRWLAGRAVLLSYEELTADAGCWLRDHIGPLLGVPPMTPATKLLKQNTLPLSEQITNYREVAALLESSVCRQYHAWPWQAQHCRKAA